MADAIGHGELNAEERAELARLRERAAHRPTARSVGSAVLVVLGCLLAPVALVAVWLHTQVADTDRFVETMSPLARDPAVRAVLTDRVTDAVLAELDVRDLADQAVDALADQGLPPGLATALHGLTGPLESNVRGFAHARIAGLFAGDRFAQTWDGVLRAAHHKAVAVLADSAPAVSVTGDDVVLDLAPFVDAARTRLVDSGLEIAGRIPDVHPTITIAEADTLVRARTAYSLLGVLAAWLPWVTVGLLASGVALARRHRRTVAAGAIGVAAGMVVLAAALAVGRAVLARSVAADAGDAATAAFDLAVRFLRDGLRTLLVLAVVIALAAWLAGPSPSAVRLRGTVGRLRRREARPGPVGHWVHRNRVPLRWLVAGSAALVFVFLDRPGGVAVLVLTLAVALCLVVIQVLDRPPVASPG